jgi:hypothetical protein
MIKSKFQAFKWLPLAAIGMVLPSVYLWLFLWCLKLNVNFWIIYTLLYSGTIVSPLLRAQAKTKRDRHLFRSNNQPFPKQFTLSRQQLSQSN